MKVTNKNDARRKRHWRIRRRVTGTSFTPRLCVHRSLKHIYVQLIDDIDEKTLAACGTNSKDFKKQYADRNNNKRAAEALGEMIAEKALEQGIKKAVFDRSGYKYHGRIKILADSARKKGLKV